MHVRFVQIFKFVFMLQLNSSYMLFITCMFKVWLVLLFISCKTNILNSSLGLQPCFKFEYALL